MNRGRPLAETVHLTALGLWLGTVVMAGVAAATIFPTIKEINPQIPAYAKYTGEHWLIVAGQPAAKIFLRADVIQFVCATLAILSMGVLLFRSRIPLNRPSAIIRVLALVAALGVFGVHSIYLAPRMQINMRGYWEAAALGNTAEAAKYQQIFQGDHPLSTRLMGATAITVFLALVAGAWSAATSGITPPPAPPKPKPSQYEEPALLRSKP